MRARNWILLVVLVAMTASAGAAVLWWKGPHPQPPTPTPSLVIANGRDDFGTTWLTNHFEWTIPIQNQDTVPIQVESIGLSCSCVQIVPSSFTIQPGEEVTLRLVIDLTTKQRSTEEAAFELLPVIRSGSSETQKLHWTIRGKVRPFLVVDQPLTFGRTSVLSVAHAVDADFSTAEPIPGGFDVRASLPDFSAVVTTDPHQPTRHHIRVMHTGSRTLSDFSLEVRLTPRDVESGRFPPLAFQLGGQIVPDIEPIPIAVLAGGITVGELSTHSVSLTSLSGSPFEVLGHDVYGEGLSVTAEGGEYRVTQRAIRTGEQSGHVTFRVRTAAGGESVALLRVSYLGINP